MTALKALSVTRAHHGALHRFQLESETLKCATVFSVFCPGRVESVGDVSDPLLPQRIDVHG
jgi:hypothetical protein